MDNLRYLWVYYSFSSFNAIFLFGNSFSWRSWYEICVFFISYSLAFSLLSIDVVRLNSMGIYLHSHRNLSETMLSKVKWTKKKKKKNKQSELTQCISLSREKKKPNIKQYLSFSSVLFGGPLKCKTQFRIQALWNGIVWQI